MISCVCNGIKVEYMHVKSNDKEAPTTHFNKCEIRRKRRVVKEFVVFFYYCVCAKSILLNISGLVVGN